MKEQSVFCMAVNLYVYVGWREASTYFKNKKKNQLLKDLSWTAMGLPLISVS